MKRPLFLTLPCLFFLSVAFNSCDNGEEEPAPEIVSISPDHGEIGSDVTISGKNFTTNATVSFNGVEANVTSASATELIATVPANATTGTVTVTANDQTATGPVFTVEFPPVIASIDPLSGVEGDEVTISGSNFSATASQNIVKFNGTAAAVTTASATQLIVTVPSGITTGAVTVEVVGKTATGPVFSVIPPPVITTVEPDTAKVGDAVTITGTNFSATAAENIVTFNGENASITSATATELVVVIPLDATSGPLTVNVNGQVSEAIEFVIMPPPSISTLAPSSGKAGDNITITGTNFSATAADNIVKFNGTTAMVISATATELVVEVPSGATSGTITVEVNGMTATSTDFTVTLPPTISSLSPTSGTVGVVVTITGTNFSTTASENIVKFNGTSATVTSATATSLTVAVPAGATTGPVAVTVGGMKASGSDFTVMPPPAISSISPTSGVSGTTVTITGTNFSTTLNDNTVRFNGTKATVTNATALELIVVVPAGAATGEVTVKVNGGTATGPIFTVTPSFTINVSTGVAGCDNVTITGTGFSTTASENEVRFNGVLAQIYPDPTSTQIVARVPGTATSGMITVTTTTNGVTANGPDFTVLVNEATTTMDDIEYTYPVICDFIAVGDEYWIAASGGFTSAKPSFAVNFLGPTRPSTPGSYAVEITAERPGETWQFTPATVDVSFDVNNRMTVSFTDVLLEGRDPFTVDKEFSAVITIY